MQSRDMAGELLNGASPVAETAPEMVHEEQRSEVGINEISERKGSFQQKQSYMRLFSDSNKPKEDIPAQVQQNSTEPEKSPEDITEVNLNSKKERQNLIVSKLSAGTVVPSQENGKSKENMDQCHQSQLKSEDSVPGNKPKDKLEENEQEQKELEKQEEKQEEQEQEEQKELEKQEQEKQEQEGQKEQEKQEQEELEEKKEGEKELEKQEEEQKEQEKQEQEGQKEQEKQEQEELEEKKEGEKELEKQEKEEQKEQEKQEQVSVPERAEEQEDQSMSSTDVRESAQEKGGTEKQCEQHLLSADCSDPAKTACDSGDTNAKGKKWTIAETLILLVLISFSFYLICQAAPSMTLTSKVRGSGRAEQGQSYNLTCETVGRPDFGAALTHVWYKNGKALRDEKKQVLLFPKLNQSDTGRYECEPELPVEKSLRMEPFPLQVLVFQNMTMVPEMEMEVKEGGTALINCSINSVPTAQLVWTMDGTILRTVESNFDSLILQNASQFHLKVVHCQATNREFFMQFEEKYTKIRIEGTFEKIPKPRIMSSEELSVLGQTFRLLCRVLDLPPNHVNINLTYLWYKDSIEIPHQYGRVLPFPKLAIGDGGQYQCTARDRKSQTTSPRSDVYDVSIFRPARVYMEPATPDAVIKLAAGEELTLICKVKEAYPSVPDDGYGWSFLPSSQGPPRTLGVRGNTLTLGPLTKNYSGNYTCEARNDQDIFEGQIPPGNATVTVDVAYLGKIDLTPDPEVNENDQVTLTCTVESNPTANLTWVVDGREVRHVTYNVDHYVLERAACSDSKTYTCCASNPALPDHDRSASTTVRVNCGRGESASGAKSSSPLWLLLLLPLVAIPITVLVCCYRKRLHSDGIPPAAAQENPGQ